MYNFMDGFKPEVPVLDPYEAVLEFHKLIGAYIGSKPEIPSKSVVSLRINLIAEEFNELLLALQNEDIIEVADGLADLLYVVYGTAISCGIDIRDIFQEVHRSNLTKVGGGKREDGKALKTPTYDPPHLEEILRRQGGI